MLPAGVLGTWDALGGSRKGCYLRRICEETGLGEAVAVLLASLRVESHPCHFSQFTPYCRYTTVFFLPPAGEIRTFRYRVKNDKIDEGKC